MEPFDFGWSRAVITSQESAVVGERLDCSITDSGSILNLRKPISVEWGSAIGRSGSDSLGPIWHSTGLGRFCVASRGACKPRKKYATLYLPNRSTHSQPNSGSGSTTRRPMRWWITIIGLVNPWRLLAGWQGGFERLDQTTGCRCPVQGRDETNDYTRRSTLLTISGRGFDSPRLHLL